VDENELLKIILQTNPGGQRGRGRQISRWIDGVDEDARKLGWRNWLADSQDRRCWRHLLEEPQGPLKTVEPKMMMIILQVRKHCLALPLHSFLTSALDRFSGRFYAPIVYP
jgi:hypothetical protein